MGSSEDLLRPYRDPARAATYDKRASTTRTEMRVLGGLLGRTRARGLVLDMPCGNGRLAPHLRSRGWRRLVGCDASPAMLGPAAEAYDGVVAGDASAAPLRDGIADVAVCLRLLHHLPERRERVAVLRELRRLSRGDVVFSFYDRRTLEGLRRRWRPKRPSGRVGLCRAEIREDLREAGLRPVKMVSLLRFVREQTLVLARGPIDREARSASSRAEASSME